jgi:hypothetical protein
MLEEGGSHDVDTTTLLLVAVGSVRKDIDMEDKMLNIRQVRDRLGLSAHEVIRLVRNGRLRAYRYAGGPVSRSAVRFDTQGLRFRESDIEAMLEDSLVN